MPLNDAICKDKRNDPAPEDLSSMINSNKREPSKYPSLIMIRRSMYYHSSIQNSLRMLFRANASDDASGELSVM